VQIHSQICLGNRAKERERETSHGGRERRFEGLTSWRNKVRLVSLLERMSHELQEKGLRKTSLQKGSEGTGEEI